MNLLIDERQKKQSQTEDALEAERTRAVELARQADNLKDLIAKLESALTPAVRSAHEQARSIEEDVATLKLASMGIRIDSLSSEQKHYLTSWQNGT